MPSGVFCFLKTMIFCGKIAKKIKIKKYVKKIKKCLTKF